ncbi:MAG TPA: hypothetical protein VLD55_08520 [Candidatus Sulfobium mesophilum]|nr:hypothetical protein [Candidatus Sulfobium mesophilum]
MKKQRMVFLGIGLLLFVAAVFPVQSYAGVNVSVGINLPAFTFAAPPPMVVIPGTYAYYAPDASVDILFYGGYWYRPYGGRWYRATGYNGPWVYIASTRVPRVLIDVPHDYRHAYGGHSRIAYQDFHRNWRRWERDKYWEHNERWREGAHDRGRHEGRNHEGRHYEGGGREEHHERGGRY